MKVKKNRRSSWSDDHVNINSSRKEQHQVPSNANPGLKVTSLSEPKLTQSFSQRSSADVGPLVLPAVLRDQPDARTYEEQQRKKGDNHRNHCDLLLIVYQTRRSGGKKHNKIHCKLNCLCLNYVCFEGEKSKFCDRGHIWQWHHNLQRPIREADKPSQKGSESILTIHFWNYLHIDPGTSASKAGTHWP